MAKVCSDCEGYEPPCCECGDNDHCCHACYIFQDKPKHEPVTKFSLIDDSNFNEVGDYIEQIS